MRFLVHELSYETPVAAGRYAYFENEQPTGAVESWRLTEAIDGYRILRVDLDARAAKSGDSYLYHLTLNPAGRPERLNFRFFRAGLRIQSNVLFEREQVTLSREVNGERRDEEWTPEMEFCFWFPAAAGLSLLTTCGTCGAARPALTLEKEADFGLRATALTLVAGEVEEIVIQEQARLVRPVTVQWADQMRVMWLDEQGWPVQVARNDLLARQTQYVRYG